VMCNTVYKPVKVTSRKSEENHSRLPVIFKLYHRYCFVDGLMTNNIAALHKTALNPLKCRLVAG